MRTAFATILFCCLLFKLNAQEIVEREFSNGNSKYSYARYLDRSEPQTLLLSFFDPDSLTAEQHLQQYFLLADSRGWLALAFPFKPSDDKKYWQAVQKAMESELSIRDTAWRIFQLVDHTPWLTALPGNAGTRALAGHLLYTPQSPIGAEAFNALDNSSVALLSEHSTADSLSDSLAMSGAWVRLFQAPEPRAQRALMSSLPLLDKALSWMDSINVVTSDSAFSETAEQRMGISNALPEIVKEGKVIRLEVFVPTPANCRFELLDLSGKAAWAEKPYLGRGEVRFSIPTRGLNWGVYQLEVEVGRKIQRHKIIIRG